MRALLAFTGSRGDAQPGILLARALRARGHEVTLALAPNLLAFAAEYGVPAVAFGRDSAELLRAQRTDHRFTSRDPRARLRALFELQRRGVPEALNGLRTLAPGHDVLVAGMAGEEVGESVARAVRLPFAALHFFPIQPNTAVPVVPARWAERVPGVVHRWGWSALARARAAALAPVLPTVGRSPAAVPTTVGTLWIQAYDARLFPGLAEEISGPFTGFPVDLPTGSTASGRDRGIRRRSGAEPPSPSAALHSWLDAGTAPIYVGFGSMDVGDPADLVAILRSVCARRGRRLLLVSGWASIVPQFGADLAVVDQVDHAEVLPRCVAAVHHGGAGTTAAALRAGVPQVICSVQADQPYWGQALRRLGLAATMPAKQLTAPRLQALLDRVDTPGARHRAHAYAAGFTTDGVERAADAIEALANIPQPIHVAGRPL
ncbi:glycosyltransferase [Nocardia halotolerans]|uniref:Glycosyltransferase n=1 Tax=Nocardia halotolerans TaxID=1755878 RepID=A0ABV8VB65_9NOCA